MCLLSTTLSAAVNTIAAAAAAASAAAATADRVAGYPDKKHAIRTSDSERLSF